MSRDENGRIISPLLWNKSVEHLLSNNYGLAKRILFSNLKRIRAKSPDILKQYNGVIQKQIDENIIEQVDLDLYLKDNSGISFLPHSAVIRENAETTKLRVVFNANLSDKFSGGLSHNQVSFSGRNLNNTLFDSLLFLRFDKYMLCYDICSAFLQIKIRDSDTKKLLFLWFKDPENQDFTIVAYRFLRLGFGLKFSPNILLCALYFILIKSAGKDDDRLRELKRKLMFLTYMDNIAFTSSSEDDIRYAYVQSIEFFKEFCFDLQKHVTNLIDFQTHIDEENNIDTEVDTKLFGLLWNRANDTFRATDLHLDPAAKTKRSILSSLNSQYDLLGLYLPVLLPAKFFFNILLNDRELGWDDFIGEELQRDWVKICTKVNSYSQVTVQRNMGDRKSDFVLIVCSDASKLGLGLVCYLWDKGTNKVSFMFSKNRLIGKNLKTKSMPILELVALAWAVETVTDVYKTLTTSMYPIKISRVLAFSDSTIALSWVKARAVKFEKIERKAVLLNNKVNSIVSNCESVSVEFAHIDGSCNPSDCVSRIVSQRKLIKSNFLSGPNIALLQENPDNFVVPTREVAYAGVTSIVFSNPLIDLEKHSSFGKAARIMKLVIVFIQKYLKNCKHKLTENSRGNMFMKKNAYSMASQYLIRKSQERAFPEVFKFFNGESRKSVPIITQLNLTLDSSGFLRVKSMFGRLGKGMWANEPVLLSKSCNITRSLIRDFHLLMKHAQTHKILTALRWQFYVPSAYSVVKSVLNRCVFCKQLYGRTLPVNTNDYRSFRSAPGQRPFQSVMCDFTGAYLIKNDQGEQTKHYILLICCMFTRSVRLHVCPSLDTASFLYALQTHIFEFGIPEAMGGDNEASFDLGFRMTSDFLDQKEIDEFLKENNIAKLSYKPYPSRASHLGGSVETLIGQVKRVLYASIGKRLLNLRQFQFVVSEAQSLVNKRPIAYKEALSSGRVEDLNQLVITPETLIRGYEAPTFNILPHLSSDELKDKTWNSDKPASTDELVEYFHSFSRARNELYELYEKEFLRNLEKQATNKQTRYKRKVQPLVESGDLVAIRTKLLKPFFFPRAIVVKSEYNNVGELNALSLRKSNGEVIRRHPSDVILLQSSNSPCDSNDSDEEFKDLGSNTPKDLGTNSRPQRRAKLSCMRTNKLLSDSNLV